MLKNYFKVALRNLFRNKGFSFINISGLSIGMASAILILLWIQNEMSYDRFHAKVDRLYEVWSNDTVDGRIRSMVPTPQLLGPALTHDYPEIEDAARIWWNNGMLFTYKNKVLKSNGTWVDPSFLTMFSFPLLKGNAAAALSDPHSIVLTEKLARKLFGDEDPLGKTVKLGNDENFNVTGVLKDLPNNTMFDFEWINSSEWLRAKGYFDTDWTDVSIRTFVLLKPGTSLANINSKIKNIQVRYSGNRSATQSFLYPVSQLRLYSNFENGRPVDGRITTVRIFGLIAAFILSIACINFMNLSTARSEKRAKEVGIRKVAGALKRSLVGQFLGESLLMAVLAGIIALLIVHISLPSFNELTGKQLVIDYNSVGFWALALGFVVFTGLLAGSYPAFFLSSFRPVSVLKGTFKKMNTLIAPRQVLVVLQFTIAIALIIATIIVQQQIKYAQDRKSGYNKSNLIYVAMEGDINKNYESLKNDLLNSGVAENISRTLSPFTQLWSAGHSLSWEGKNPANNIEFVRSSTDGNLVKTAGMQLAMGRDIDLQKYPSDSTACIINEAAAKAMGFKDPIGKTISDDPDTWHIVGVVKDFILESPYEPVKPFIFKGPKYGGQTLNIRLNTHQPMEKNLAGAETIFKKYNPAYPFEYHFVDEEYASKFSDEQLIRTLAALFAGLTIFISCLGLFGLAAFMAENRIKEIGIRKVLGASAANIAFLLSGNFIRLVIAAILIASPIAWWAMSQWLRGYSYRIDIGWGIFVLAGALAVLIALATVSFQAVRAALSNPVKNLRTE